MVTKQIQKAKIKPNVKTDSQIYWNERIFFLKKKNFFLGFFGIYFAPVTMVWKASFRSKMPMAQTAHQWKTGELSTGTLKGTKSSRSSDRPTRSGISPRIRAAPTSSWERKWRRG